jgi:hypothetical protein
MRRLLRPSLRTFEKTRAILESLGFPVVPHDDPALPIHQTGLGSPLFMWTNGSPLILIGRALGMHLARGLQYAFR